MVEWNVVEISANIVGSETSFKVLDGLVDRNSLAVGVSTTLAFSFSFALGRLGTTLALSFALSFTLSFTLFR